MKEISGKRSTCFFEKHYNVLYQVGVVIAEFGNRKNPVLNHNVLVFGAGAVGQYQTSAAIAKCHTYETEIN